jgi:hypothetical protein
MIWPLNESGESDDGNIIFLSVVERVELKPKRLQSLSRFTQRSLLSKFVFIMKMFWFFFCVNGNKTCRLNLNGSINILDIGNDQL